MPLGDMRGSWKETGKIIGGFGFCYCCSSDGRTKFSFSASSAMYKGKNKIVRFRDL